MTRSHLRRLSVLMTIAIALLALWGTGCTTTDSTSFNNGNGTASGTASGGTLHGDWWGSQVAGTTLSKIEGSVQHVAGAEDFVGSFTIGGLQYSVDGTLKGDVLTATLTNPRSKLRWDGTYAGKRFAGRFTALAGDATPAAGDVSIINLISIPGQIDGGPWLLYTQDNDKGLGSMTIRVAVNGENFLANTTVTDTNPTNPITYGSGKMFANGAVGGRTILQYTCTGLPSNRLFNYTIGISDDKHTSTPDYVKATFRTPPSWADIRNGTAQKQIFFGTGDNRRDVEKSSDELPMVEKVQCQLSALSTDPEAQACILHNGDAAALGHSWDDTAPPNNDHVGWGAEWLRASNDSNDHHNHDWRYHTWMRASLPTFMSAGNHEGKKIILQTNYGKDDFKSYGKLMAGVYGSEDQHVNLGSGADVYDTYTYMADYGGARVIVLNTYDCFSEDDSNKILAKVEAWLNPSQPVPGPIFIVLHPSPYGSMNDEVGNYWSPLSKLTDKLYPLVNGKKNVIVISGHIHQTSRTVQQAVNYYVLGTGGAPDMNTSNRDTDKWVMLSGAGKTIYTDYSWAQFNVDYPTRHISVVITGTDGKRVDEWDWAY